MDRSRLELFPKVWLDHRRTVFLEEEGVLAIADLHLGYTWAHRYNGQMLPVYTADPLLERLSELCAYYEPRSVAFLGDIVHAAVPVSEIAAEFQQLVEHLGRHCGLTFILGNHDKKLQELAPGIQFRSAVTTGKFHLIHGHEEPMDVAGDAVILMGHEHPAISLGDGIASARFPCFVAGESILILPAFSQWVAGTNIRAYEFMSPVAQRASFLHAFAICGEKLLPVKLG